MLRFLMEDAPCPLSKYFPFGFYALLLSSLDSTYDGGDAVFVFLGSVYFI